MVMQCKTCRAYFAPGTSSDALLFHVNECQKMASRSTQTTPMSLTPRSPEVRRRRLSNAGQSPRATLSRLEIVAEQTPSAMILNDLGTAYRAVGDTANAVRAFLRAIDLNRRCEAAYGNVGNILIDIGEPRQAMQYYSKAIGLNPHFFDGHMNLATLCTTLGRWEKAIIHYGIAHDLNPSHGPALWRLTHAELSIGHWECYGSRVRAIADLVAADLRFGRCSFIQPGDAQLLPLPPTLLTGLRTAYAQQVAASVAGLPRPTFTPRSAHMPLRVGYLGAVAADARPAVHTIVWVLKHHDKTRVHTTIYGMGRAPEHVPHEAQEVADRYVDVARMTDADAARVISHDRIDVLIQYSTGRGAVSRPGIIARRPAPVTVSFMNGSGAGAGLVDYIVADPVAVPPDLSYLYEEALVTLDRSFYPAAHRYLMNDAVPEEDIEVMARGGGELRARLRADLAIPDDAICLACFNQTPKLDPTTFTAWARIMVSHPSTVLLLQQDPPEAVPRLRSRASAMGIDPARLIFVPADPHAPPANRVRWGAAVDVYLDTHHCSGRSSVADALWLGVPVVAHPQAHIPSRVAASMLVQAGAEELVARDTEEYVSIATRLIDDPVYRLAMRRMLVDSRGKERSIFDIGGWVTTWEAALFGMWGQWVRGGQPVTFNVGDLEA